MVRSIFGSESLAYFSLETPIVHLSKKGKLHIEGQEDGYQVRLMSKKGHHSLSEREQKLIREFFTDFLQKHPIGWSKGKLKKLTLTIEPSGQIKALIVQKDDFTHLKEKKEIDINDVAFPLPKLEPKSTSIPLLQVSKSKESSLLHLIGHLFKRLVELLFGKSTPLSLEIIYEFKNIVKYLPIKVQKEIYHQLSQVTEDERAITRFLHDNLDLTGLDVKEVFSHILRGAYVVLEDQGAVYKQWSTTLKSRQERISSHEADAPQYGIRGPFIKECLFSRKKIKENGQDRVVSWFQLERYPSKIGYYSRHLITFFRYRRTKENQGPWGSSFYTEKNPLVLKIRSPLS